MKVTLFTHVFARALTLAILFLGIFAFTAKTGLDGYEIYLNDKLILKQFVNQPLNLRKLQLEKADANDQLSIRYNHCNIDGSGTSRSIVIKDGNGKTIKRWEFADAIGSNERMVIPVKELLQLEKNYAHHELSLYYTAKELPIWEMLASFRLD